MSAVVARHLNPSFFASWREQTRAPAAPRHAHGARHLVGHGIVVFSIAVLATMSLILLSPAFSFSTSMRGEESLAVGLIVAAAVFALITRREQQLRGAGPTETYGPRVPMPAPSPAPFPVPDDRGRGRGGDRFRGR